MSRPILCLDFDGVLHSYTSGWRGPRVIPDPPVKGAMAFVVAASEVFEVQVYSSRSRYWLGRFAMARWMFLHMAEYLGGTNEAATAMGKVKFPRHKPPAMITIDDRAVTFNGTWPQVDELLAFRPWNKR